MHFETTVEIDAPRDIVWSTLAEVDKGQSGLTASG